MYKVSVVQEISIAQQKWSNWPGQLAGRQPPRRSNTHDQRLPALSAEGFALWLSLVFETAHAPLVTTMMPTVTPCTTMPLLLLSWIIRVHGLVQNVCGDLS